jgi:hypothetical protein
VVVVVMMVMMLMMAIMMIYFPAACDVQSRLFASLLK